MPRQSQATLQLLQIARFVGISSRISKFLIKDEQAQSILNFVFDELGALTKISGFTQWNGTSLGASTMLGGDRFYKTGAAAEFVQAHNGKLHKGNDGTQTFTEIFTGLNTTAKVRMKNNRDLLFIVNGVDENKKWNGTTVTKMGLTAPTTAPTAADGGAGNLNGTYTNGWVYTFVSATMESNASPASNTLTLTNRQASLTGIAVSSDTQVTKRRIYRVAAGGTERKFVGEIANNVTTIFTDNVADASLGADVTTQKDPPVIAKFLEAYKNRLWLAGDGNNPRRIYFSEYFEPEAWPTTFFIDVPMTAGDEITGLKVLSDALVIYGHNTPFILIGETPFDFTVKRSFAHVGTESDRSITVIENAHVYLSRSGVYAFNGAVSKLLSDDVEPLLNDINSTYISNAAAAYHEKKKFYRLAVTSTVITGATTNNREYIYDLRASAWTTTDRTIAYYNVLDGPGDTGKLFSASPSAGILNEENVGNSANGAAILCSWKSKAYILGTIDFTKTLRHLLFWSEPNPDNITLEAKLEDDANKTQTFTIGASSALSLYGTGTYGTSTYGGPRLRRVANSFDRKMVGQYVEVSVQSTGTNPIKIYSVEVSFRANPHLRIR